MDQYQMLDPRESTSATRRSINDAPIQRTRQKWAYLKTWLKFSRWLTTGLRLRIPDVGALKETRPS